jgi:hypothetical protein
MYWTGIADHLGAASDGLKEALRIVNVLCSSRRVRASRHRLYQGLGLNLADALSAHSRNRRNFRKCARLLTSQTKA